jgi:hypothetical protein
MAMAHSKAEHLAEVLLKHVGRVKSLRIMSELLATPGLTKSERETLINIKQYVDIKSRRERS